MAFSEFVLNIANEHAQVVSITVLVAVLCLCLAIGHLLEENRWVNESITALLIGSITGTIILFISKGTSFHILRFNEELFFIYLLPPIIFNAGFQVKKKQFFQNFFPIMLFGVIGVFISSLVIAAGCWWLFPILDLSVWLQVTILLLEQFFHQQIQCVRCSPVFGEGVVNDATSVVLFNALQELDASRLDGWAAVHVLGDFLYLFSISTVLGVSEWSAITSCVYAPQSIDIVFQRTVSSFCNLIFYFLHVGLLTAYVLKGLYLGRHSSVREIALMVLMAYLSYILAEVMTHVQELQPGPHMFAAISFIAETFIFLYVGMDALDIEMWKMSKLSFWTSMGTCRSLSLLILLGRAAFLFPLSAFSNYVHRTAERSSSITFKHQFTYYGVTMDPVNATMVTITIIIVLFSTIVFGFLTKPLISYLLPQHANNSGIHREPMLHKVELRLPLLSFEESAATNTLSAERQLVHADRNASIHNTLLLEEV
ncbi:hypothetical protein F0562_008880 [Nyssa sinensis]|uniref:Cation/H+ exchanger transmembrane domain-containing protein n=1 Tax=Nyssa sinensis TaxID=561372 RepID=A0A5J5AC96_9ASTE|nr:hypothetical protein F0562_008880 [Nyssa sinensis]